MQIITNKIKYSTSANPQLMANPINPNKTMSFIIHKSKAQFPLFHK